MNVQSIEPTAEPRMNVDETHAACWMVNCIGLSSCNRRDNEGDDQPKYEPNDIIPKLPIIIN